MSISPIRYTVEDEHQDLIKDPQKAMQVWLKSRTDLQKKINHFRDRGWMWDGERNHAVTEIPSVESLDAKQALWQAQGEGVLIQEEINRLKPETLIAYNQGISSLEKKPLISGLLRRYGRLIPKSVVLAERDHCDALQRVSQYDRAIWLPPAWIDGESRSLPESVARDLHREGLLSESTPNALWNALDLELETYRLENSAYAKAEQVVREAEKIAQIKSKIEAQAWRDKMNARCEEDWNLRKSLIGDLIYFNAFLYLLPKEKRNQIDGFLGMELLGDSTSPFGEVKRRMELMLRLLDELIVSKGGMTSYPLMTGKTSDRNVNTSHAKPRISESTGAGIEDIGSLKRRLLAGGILALCVLSLFWTDYRERKVIGLTELVALCGAWTCIVWLWTESANRFYRRWWKK